MTTRNYRRVRTKPKQAEANAKRAAADKKRYDDACDRAALQRRLRGKKRSILKGPTIFT